MPLEPEVGELQTCFDAKEGYGHDFAVQRRAIGAPETKRSFTASGRRRWQHRVDTMERMFAEEKEFDHTLAAIELSSDDSVLYTATTRHVFREDISGGPPGPDHPHDAWFLQSPEDEEIRDIRLLPSPNHDDGVYVLTRKHLYVLTYDPQTGAFTQRHVEPQPDGLYQMGSLVVHQNVNGAWRGYVMGIANTPQKGAGRGVAVCDLGDPLGTPPNHGVQFLVDGGKSVWDPRVNANGDHVFYGSAVWNMALANVGGTTVAYVACGFERQVTVIDTLYGGGGAGLWTNELDAVSPPKAVLDRIVLGQSFPPFDIVRGVTLSHDGTLLYVLDRDQIWTVDPAHGPGFPKSAAPHEFGILGEYDINLVEFGPTQERHVWTMAMGTCPYLIKRFSVDTSGQPLPAGEVYGMSTSDGAVAIPDPAAPENSVIFTPTMGGVVKFTTQDATEPQTFELDIDSFQPSSTTSSAFAHSTEQIAIGDLGDASAPEWHIYTACATGSILDFALDANLDPQPPVELEPPSIGSWLPWNFATDYTYGTSVEFADLGDRGKWVLYDYIDRTIGELSLIAVRVDQAHPIWHVVRAADTSVLAPNLWTWHLNVSENWALLSFEDGEQLPNNGKSGGFAMFDLRNIGTSLFEAQTPVFVTCPPFDKVGGVAMNADEDLILVSLANHENKHRPGYTLAGGIYLYALDDSVSPPRLRKIEQMVETPVPTDQGGPGDDFDWGNFDSFDTGYRARWFRHNGIDTWAVVQYIGGWVHQFSYDPTRSPALDLDAVWHGKFDLGGKHWEGYSGEGQDVRVYDFGFGPRILNAQNEETFALLKPHDL